MTSTDRRTGTDPADAPVRRRSRQRDTLRAYLGEQAGFRTAQDIHADLRARGETIGLATVYRALQLLVEDGEVDMLRTPEGEQAYRRCATPRHHHHLVCRACGRTVEVSDPPVARWAEQVAQSHGFTDVEHLVEVFGTCADCSA